MPDAPTSPTGGWWPSLDRVTPFESLAEVQRAHAHVRGSMQAALQEGAERVRTAEEIRTFIARTQSTGGILVDRNERRAAQSLIDYWSAELAGRPDALKEDFAPKRLASTDATVTTSGGERIDKAVAASEPRPRELIRLAATARLWRDSRNKGYLLSGRAIEEAARFGGADADIDNLVQASKAVRSGKRLRTISYLGLVGIALAAIGACMLAYLFVFPTVRDATARRLHRPHSSATTEWLLARLSFAQRWSPPADPPDLSLATLSGVRLNGGYALYYPNLSESLLDDAEFRDAQLPSAYFGDSIIKGSHFDRAGLPLAQFRHATIRATVFDGAELYRANFDDATLCGVSFRAADLRQASFRGAELGSEVTLHFSDTAWWLATNWRSADIEALLPTVPIEGPQAVDALERLKGSVAFKADRARYLSWLSSALEHFDLEQAQALNNMAWTLATWGIDVHPAHPDNRTGCRSERLPEDAVEAADRAICIVGTLAHSSSTDSQTENFVDTRAYLSLQNQRPQEAIDRLNSISAKSGGTLFRYAVAQYAVRQQKAGLDNLKLAMERDEYVPSHELQTLRAYIEGEFKANMYKYIDARSPSWRSHECAAARK